VAGRADQIDRFVATLRLHLSHHAPDVILHRKFRQVQAGGDFLICQALSDQMHQLELAVRQAIFVRSQSGSVLGFQSVLV